MTSETQKWLNGIREQSNRIRDQTVAGATSPADDVRELRKLLEQCQDFDIGFQLSGQIDGALARTAHYEPAADKTA